MELSNIDKNKTCVVYCIENIINKKKYIGITKNKLRARINAHIQKAKRKTNLPLYNAINTYGKNNFKIYIIKECNTEEELSFYEIKYINELRTSINNFGYNILTDQYVFNKARIGKKNSEKHNDILSQRMKCLQSQYLKYHIKKWVVISPTREIFYIENLQKFCRENNLDAPNMIKLITSTKRKFHKGWQCFKNSEFSQDKIKIFYNGIKLYFEDGKKEIISYSLRQYAIKNNYDYSSLRKLINNKIPKYKHIVKIENIIL